MPEFHLVNTNETHRPKAKDLMLAEHCVAAQYEPKTKIDTIGRGDVVFVFQNGVGIIAVGIADGKVLVSDYEGDRNEQHLMRLHDFREVDPPIPAGTISEVCKSVAGIGVFFARTVNRLRPDAGKALYSMLPAPSGNRKQSINTRTGRMFVKIPQAKCYEIQRLPLRFFQS
jgi:hypothetical protein